jgi:hypothetical protein
MIELVIMIPRIIFSRLFLKFLFIHPLDLNLTFFSQVISPYPKFFLISDNNFKIYSQLIPKD